MSDRSTRFLLWCSGSDDELLRRVPRAETVRQVGFGTLVLIPAVLAFGAMSYALSTLTSASGLYLAGGAVWAAIVFCFDRFIVSTFRKSGDTWSDVTSLVFVSRLVFALFVGVVVAHPLVMLYFHESIDERLARNERHERQSLAAAGAARIELLNVELGSLEADLSGREARRNELQATLNAEIDGIVTGRTTGIPGRGESAREKQRQLRLAESEFDLVRSQSAARASELRDRIAAIEAAHREEAGGYTAARDYLARAEALGALTTESSHVRTVHWFLILFFVFVDTLPILFKGFTSRGPYDVLLGLEEFESERASAARREALGEVGYPHKVAAAEAYYAAGRGYSSLDEAV